MTTSDDEQNGSSDLATRSEPTLFPRSEEPAADTAGEDLESLSPEAVRRLLHGLRVHQIELEMQNEQLRRTQEELAAEREHTFDLYNLAPVGLVTLGEQGLILEANLAVATLLGVAAGALIQQPWKRFILPEDQDIYTRHRKQLFATGEPQACQMRMVRQGDAPFWARVEATMARDDRGAPVCRATLRDITERTPAEAALRQAKELNEGIVQNVNEGILMTDALGIVTFANPALAAMLGYAPGDLVGQPWQVLVPPDQQAIVRAADHRRADKQSDRYELTLLRKCSAPPPSRQPGIPDTAPETVSVLVSGSPCFDAQTGLFAGTLAVITDISQRVQAALERERLLAQLREQALRIQGILNTVPEGVLLLDGDGRVLLANPAAECHLSLLASCPDREPAGAEAGDPLIPGSPPPAPVVQAGQVVTHLGNRPLAELLVPPPPGLWHEVQAGALIFLVIAQPIEAEPLCLSDTGQAGAAYWVLVIADVTSDRRLHDQLHQQEGLAAIGQLAAGIAHDLNNVMAVIVLAGQALQESPRLLDGDRRYLAMIRDRADHATKLIGQILDFGRRSYMELAPLDLLLLLTELLELLEYTLPENIRLELVSDRSECIIHGDATRLQNVLMNLAINARDAMPSGGRLQFALSGRVVGPGLPPPLPDMAPGEWVCLAVSDSGIGIAAEQLPHLFEPFFTTKEPGQGSGLGLSQVYGIVRQHEGAIGVHSRPGEGTTFSIFLPLLTIPAREVQPAPAEEAGPGGTETILLAEDDPAVRLVVAETLQGLGYRVLPFASGTEALAILEQAQPIDLLLSDLIMPGLSGLDLCQALRRRWPTVKGLIMTGYTLVGAGYGVVGHGAVDWIQKPFDLDDLAAKIREILDGHVSAVQSCPLEGGR